MAHIAEKFRTAKAGAQVAAERAIADDFQRHGLLHFLLRQRQGSHAFLTAQAADIEEIIPRSIARDRGAGINTVDDHIDPRPG